jgi:hypothetical protein
MHRLLNRVPNSEAGDLAGQTSPLSFLAAQRKHCSTQSPMDSMATVVEIAGVIYTNCTKLHVTALD